MGMDAAFATLGLAVGAQPIEITRAFRALSRATHPDCGGDRRRFEAVLAAYRVLQRTGLVTRTPVVVAPSPVADRYRTFLRDLDRAAAIVVTSAPPAARPVPLAAPSTVSTTRTSRADRFAAILERELGRRAA